MDHRSFCANSAGMVLLGMPALSINHAVATGTWTGPSRRSPSPSERNRPSHISAQASQMTANSGSGPMDSTLL